MNMQCKAAIITAVNIETESVMKLYNNWERVSVPEDEQEYYSASFTSKGREHRVITASKMLWA